MHQIAQIELRSAKISLHKGALPPCSSSLETPFSVNNLGPLLFPLAGSAPCFSLGADP